MDARAWDERYSKTDLEWGIAPNRFLVEEVGGLVPGTAVDLGAGEGRNAIWLAEKGWDVTAVDFSNVGMDKGRRLAKERGVEVRWVVEDLLDFDPPSSGFDLVIIFYVHLSGAGRERLLRRARGALRQGGTLLIVGHDRSNLVEGVGGPQDPEVLLDAAEVVASLSGLRVEKAERVLRPVIGAERDAVDTLVRATRRVSGSVGNGDPAVM